MIALPSPSGQYDAQNEAETRRSIEQAFQQIASSIPNAGGTSVGGSGTSGKMPMWTAPGTLGDSHITDGARPTVGADSLAFLSDLFTQSEADARYSLLGHTHTASEIIDFASAGDALWIGVGNFNALGDARYLQLTGGALSGPLSGTSASFSGEVDGNDFVLIGGAPGGGGGGGGGLLAVYDEGVVKTSTAASINFTGAGVVASAVGNDVTVQILFDQAAADARYSLLGHTHPASDITNFNSVGDARWLKLAGGTLTGALIAPTVQITGAGNTELINASTSTSGRAWGWLSLTDGSMGFYDVTAGYLRRLGILADGSVVLSAALSGTTADFTGEVDADDFVLVGGSGGGGASAALFSVLDEGVLKSSAVSSINFVGAGVAASAVGDAVTVTISFDQAAADARYSLLGHTHTFASLTSRPTTIEGYGITNFDALGNARWLLLSGGTLTGTLLTGRAAFGAPTDPPASGAHIELYHDGTTGAMLAYNRSTAAYTALVIGASSTEFTQGGILAPSAVINGSLTVMRVGMAGDTNPYLSFNDGTYNALWQMASGTMRLDHNGALRLAFPSAGGSQVYGMFQVIKADGSANLFIVDEASSTMTLGLDLYTIHNIFTQGAGVYAASGIVGYDNEVFTARGASVPHYGFRWTTTTDIAGDGNVRLLGGAYGGISLFTAGAEALRIDQALRVTAFSIMQANDSYWLGSAPLAGYTATYNLLYRRDGAYGILLGGSDPANYYDNTTHVFRDRTGVNWLLLSASGHVSYTALTIGQGQNSLTFVPDVADESVYMTWFNNLGSARRAYIGLGAGSGSTADLYINSDSGRVMIQANGGTPIIHLGTAGIVASYSHTAPDFILS